jgi:hypothetical protein
MAGPDLGAIVQAVLAQLAASRAGSNVLRDASKPTGVSASRLLDKLPARLKDSVPSIEQFELQLAVNSSGTR